MIIVGVVLAVLLLGAVAAWAVARADVPGVAAPVGTQSAQPLTDGPVGADQVHDLRFDQAVRGYRMEQVDRALARLADELAVRDAEIARLRGGSELVAPAGPDPSVGGPGPGAAGLGGAAR